MREAGKPSIARSKGQLKIRSGVKESVSRAENEVSKPVAAWLRDCEDMSVGGDFRQRVKRALRKPGKQWK